MNILLLLLIAQQQTPAVRVDSETISGLGARNIGSAAMSGRIAALDAVHEGAYGSRRTAARRSSRYSTNSQCNRSARSRSIPKTPK